MNDIVTIATHDGVFHADDVFAVGVLRSIWGASTVVRTRDQEKIGGADFVVDVGRVHDARRGRFDHHQGAGSRPNGIPYAAFGLVWAYYGDSYVEFVIQQKYPDLAVGANDIEETVACVDRTLVQGIDAADNGVELIGSSTVEDEHGPVRPMTVSTVISMYNTDDDAADERFAAAQEVAASILENAVVSAINWVAARGKVKKYAENSQGRVLILEEFVPWQRHLFDLGLDDDFDYVAFPGSASTPWMLQCVPPEAGSFDKKVPLPESWAGLDNKRLAEATGVDDAIFCHRGRFICGAGSLEGVLTMAELAKGGDSA